MRLIRNGMTGPIQLSKFLPARFVCLPACALVLLPLLLALAIPVHAQTNAPTDDRSGVVITTDRLDDALAVPSDLIPRPEREERPELPAEIRDRILQFENLREAYLARERELIQRVRGATEEDRDRLREQLKELREDWLRRARSIREEARERQRELLRELPKHREALEQAREQALDAARETRERRGQD